MEEKNKRFVGIDLGKRTMEVRIMKSNGDIVKSWNGKTDTIGRTKLYKQLTAGDLVALEACSLAFVIAREIEERTGAEVVVLHPARLPIIYRSLKKTDSEDAVKLARLILRNPKDELPVVPLPQETELEMRALVHEMGFLSDQRVRFVNRLHAIFVRHGITTLKKSNLKTQKMREKTLGLLIDNTNLLKEARRCIVAIDLFEEQLADLDKKEKEALRNNELTPHVMSVPGVGPSTALAFLAYIGDGSRFTRAAEVSNYIGLVPRVDISGDTVRYGHINKRYGCTSIRRVLVQAAWSLVRSKYGGALAKQYQELRDRRGSKKAIIAIARKMGELLWVLVSRRAYYREMSSVILTKKLKLYKIECLILEERKTA